MNSIKAYLFTQPKNGVAWSCAEAVDLDTLTKMATDSAADGVKAVLHIGFTCPEIGKIAALSRPWPNTLLISDFAATAFPFQFSLSAFPAGEIDGLQFRIVTQGFGWDIPDPTIKAGLDLLTASRLVGPVEWVDQLVRMRPEEMAKPLVGAGIFNEQTYLEKERDLEPAIRHAAGLARFILLVGERPSVSNIIENLHFCPPWLLRGRLSSMSITVRWRNVFKDNAIVTVQDIANFGHRLYRLRNIGSGSIYALGKLLCQCLESGEALGLGHGRAGLASPRAVPHDGGGLGLATASGPQAKAADGVSAAINQPFGGLREGLEDVLTTMGESEKKVFAARLGLGRRPVTLQDLALELKLTTERVRQIGVRAHKKANAHPCMSSLDERLQVILDAAKTPVVVAELEMHDPWFCRVEGLERVLSQILANYPVQSLHIIEVNGLGPVVSRITRAQWSEAIEGAKKMISLLANGASLFDQSSTTKSATLAAVVALLPYEARELRTQLWAEVSEHAIFALDADGQEVLRGYGRSVEAVVQSVLEIAGEPLHCAQIKQRVEEITGKQADIRRIHNAAATVGVLYSLGTYGLRAHCHIDIKGLRDIAQEVTRLIKAHPKERQWHASELVSHLTGIGMDFNGALTKFVLTIALEGSKDIVYLGRMVWGQKNSEAPAKSSRKDIRQTVIEILEANEGPMHIDHIKAALSNVRGFGRHFQLLSDDTLVSLGDNIWGLLARDVTIPNVDSNIATIRDFLERTQEGIHISEIVRVLPHLSLKNAAIMFWVCKSKGMRTDASQMLYLPEWTWSRRTTVAEAIDQLVEQPNFESLKTSEILAIVRKKIKRDLGQQNLSQALKHSVKIFYDHDSRSWKKRTTVAA